MTTEILVIDDDHELNGLLKTYLVKFGFNVNAATTPEQGLHLLKRLKPAVVILDVMLPEKDGFEVCREIRSQSSVPVLMLTARGDVTDRVVGLEIGADDYLPKPFEPRELLARIRSIMRRSARPEPSAGKFKSGPLVMDLSKRTVTLKGQLLDLTSAEYDILKFFLSRPGAALDREQILETVHSESSEAFNRSVDLAVSRLRAKLGDSGKNPRFIKTIWGTGYMFSGEVTHHDS